MPEQAPARSSLLFSRDALLRLIIPWSLSSFC